MKLHNRVFKQCSLHVVIWRYTHSLSFLKKSIKLYVFTIHFLRAGVVLLYFGTLDASREEMHTKGIKAGSLWVHAVTGLL